MNLINDVRQGLGRLDNSPLQLKKFGITMFFIFITFAVIIFLFGKTPQFGYWIAAVSIFFLLFSFVKQRVLKPVRLLWIGLSLVLGYFMSRLLLSLIFYIIMTPIRFFLFFFRKDILNIQIEKTKDTYWIKRIPKSNATVNHERLY